MAHFLQRFARSLSLSLLGIAAALILFELCIRVLNLAPPAQTLGWFWKGPDPDYGWSHIAGTSGLWFNPRNEYDVVDTINSKGLRDVERDYDKPADVFRILMLGDSYVEGLRVPLEETCAHLLEARLNSAGLPIRFEVINAGVSGWGTDQELLWFRNEGIHYEPDLVILGFYPGNDFLNNSEALEVANVGAVRKPFFHRVGDQLELAHYPFEAVTVSPSATAGVSLNDSLARIAGGQAPPLAVWRPWLQQHLAAYRFVTPLVRDSVPGLARILVGWGLLEPGQEEIDAALPANYIPVAYGVFQLPPVEAWQETFSLTSDLVRELDRTVMAVGGARLAVAILTTQEQVYPDLWDGLKLRYPTMLGQEWDLEQPNRVLHTMLDGANVPYVDLLPVFRDYSARSPGELLHFRYDGHWTAAGERVAADTLYQFLIDSKLVPVPGNAAPPTSSG